MQRHYLAVAGEPACAGLWHTGLRSCVAPNLVVSFIALLHGNAPHLQPVCDVSMNLVDQSHSAVQDVDSLVWLETRLES